MSLDAHGSPYHALPPLAQGLSIAPGTPVDDDGRPLLDDATDEREPLADDATVADVLEWVDGDPERAQDALDKENASDSPRSTLVTALEKTVADGSDPIGDEPAGGTPTGEPDESGTFTLDTTSAVEDKPKSKASKSVSK